MKVLLTLLVAIAVQPAFAAEIEFLGNPFQAIQSWHAAGKDIHFAPAVHVGRCYMKTDMMKPVGSALELRQIEKDRQDHGPGFPEEVTYIRQFLPMSIPPTIYPTNYFDDMDAARLKGMISSLYTQEQFHVSIDHPLTAILQITSTESYKSSLRSYGNYLVEVDTYFGPSKTMHVRGFEVPLNNGEVASVCYYYLQK